MSFQRSETKWNGLHTVYMDQLERLQVATLLVHGEQDKLVPLACSLAAQGLIPNAQLSIVPGAGHWPQREQPEIFNQKVSELLDCKG